MNEFLNDYEAIVAYAAFAFGVFGLAIAWRQLRSIVQKRFPLLNYHSKDDDHKHGQAAFWP